MHQKKRQEPDNQQSDSPADADQGETQEQREMASDERRNEWLQESALQKIGFTAGAPPPAQNIRAKEESTEKNDSAPRANSDDPSAD